MRRWLALALLALAGAVEAQPLTGGLLGRGASYSSFVPPAGCASGYVPYFDASLKLQCSPTVWNPTTRSLDVTDGRVQAGNLTAIPLPASGSVTVTPVLSKIGAITVVAGSALADGDALSVGDGVGVVPIEFDAAPGDGTTGGAVPIVFDGTETATQIRDAVKAILDASGRDWTTSAQGADGIGIVRATPGATGGAITESVTDAGFTVTDWTNPTAATTYTYSLQACLADGTCNAAGPASTTAAGVATLSAANPNRLSWSAVPGAASYKIRRDVGGATQGVIWSGTATTVDDTGLAGDGTAKPTADGTGVVTAGRVLVGDGSAAAPGVAFASDPRDGIFRDASGVRIGFQGQLKALFGATAITLVAPLDFGGYGSYLTSNAAGVVMAGASAVEGSKTGSFQATSFLPASNGGGDVGSTALGMKRIYIDYTNTATVGAVTINKAAGRVNIDTAGTSVVVTNSLVTASSHVLAVVSTADANAYVKNVVPAAGSFTITLGAAAAAPTSVDFFVLSSD